MGDAVALELALELAFGEHLGGVFGGHVEHLRLGTALGGGQLDLAVGLLRQPSGHRVGVLRLGWQVDLGRDKVVLQVELPRKGREDFPL